VIPQGAEQPRQLSDPLGRGWNLLGLRPAPPTDRLPDMNWVWHTQVGLILGGHVISVYLAHAEALRCFGTARKAMLSQIPMLVLMMAFTVFGLWILAQPISGSAG
ncbi:MAG: hypothetical protein VW625_08995, partial [Perlucidibaca sp.]